MFQVNANGSPRTVIAELERQATDKQGGDEPLRNKIIGFTRDTLATADPAATVALSARGTNERLEALNLTVK